MEDILKRITGKTVLATNARDEPAIREWVKYHLMTGWDYLLIYDHLSKVPIHDLVKNDRVFTFRVNDPEPPIKHKLMKAAKNIVKKHHAKWFAYIDADEYIVFDGGIGAHTYLQRFDANVGQVLLHWHMFGSSGHVVQPSGGLVNNFTRAARELHTHVKTIVRVAAIRGMRSAHVWNVKEPYLSVNASGVVLPSPEPDIGPANPPRQAAWVNHYFVMSETVYRARKEDRPMDDAGRMRGKSSSEQIHSWFNDVEDLTLKNMWGHKLLQKD